MFLSICKFSQQQPVLCWRGPAKATYVACGRHLLLHWRTTWGFCDREGTWKGCQDKHWSLQPRSLKASSQHQPFLNGSDGQWRRGEEQRSNLHGQPIRPAKRHLRQPRQQPQASGLQDGGGGGVSVWHWGGVEAVGFGGCLYFYFRYGNPVESPGGSMHQLGFLLGVGGMWSVCGW